jgi:F-type H+-transporting ATPase subunit delta
MAEFIHTDRSQDTVFDVDAERLARVYAEAGLDAAGGIAEQESLVEELESVADVLKQDPRLAQIIASELISKDEKIAMLDRLFGAKLSTATLNLLKVMARHKRLGLIRDAAKVARKMWYARAGRVPVQLETAHSLEGGLEQEILAAFSRVLGSDPIVTQWVNPDLIGGFVLRVGDRVYDGSVRTRLEHMRQGMVNRAVEAIQRSPERFVTNTQA